MNSVRPATHLHLIHLLISWCLQHDCIDHMYFSQSSTEPLNVIIKKIYIFFVISHVFQWHADVPAVLKLISFHSCGLTERIQRPIKSHHLISLCVSVSRWKAARIHFNYDIKARGATRLPLLAGHKAWRLILAVSVAWMAFQTALIEFLTDVIWRVGHDGCSSPRWGVRADIWLLASRRLINRSCTETKETQEVLLTDLSCWYRLTPSAEDLQLHQSKTS